MARHRIVARGSLWLLALALLLGLGSVSHAANINCGMSIGPCADSPVQGIALLNTQTTGAATTAVVVTIAAVTGERAHVYHIEARCNTAAATGDLTITDGGTTIWTSGPLAAIAAQPQFQRDWSTGMTGTTNSAVVVTLSACTAGTGTLIVQADRW